MKDSDLGEREQRDHLVEGQKHLGALGLASVYYASPCPENQLYVDIDVPFSQWSPSEKFIRSLDIIKQTYRMDHLPSYRVDASKGGNVHVIVDLPFAVHIEARVAWQAILGGDPIREACHLLSISRYEENPIILFRRREIKLLTDGNS